VKLKQKKKKNENEKEKKTNRWGDPDLLALAVAIQ